MIVHLIDGTYELFRHFYGARRARNGEDTRFGGVRGVLHGVLELVEKGATHIGIAVWPMIELEADDGLASAAALASADPRVEKICIWTPDKDLSQCVVEDR